MSSPTLTDKVSKFIRHDILTGQLRPGQKLVVAELKDKYNVGASPIREALVQLSWSKYVKLEPQKGSWVASVCQDELKDLFDSLRVVSSVLLQKAIESGDEHWELDVLTSFHKLSRLDNPKTDEDWSEWEERHLQFHKSLLEGANSKTMMSFFNDLINQIKRYRYFAITRMNENEELYNLEQHEKLMKAALAKDTKAAAEVLETHLTRSLTVIKKSIDAA
ncbi:FCD domain-containing protein [Vibrio sp. AK197]|uniref:GntR family transcriptional regulator n=1 Tax=Vibrio olivae TaxID=1243002 RepID=A0ABV5HPF4_9VIBR